MNAVSHKREWKIGSVLTDYRGIARWDGPEDLTLETVNQARDFSLDVINKEKEMVLTTLRGAYAARMFCLFDQERLDVRHDSFNCFGAMDTVIDGKPIDGKIYQREPIGREFSLNEPIPPYEVPFKFQLCGGHFARVRHNVTEWKNDGVICEGLVLTHETPDGPIAFHKPGGLRPIVSSWQQALGVYSRDTKIVRFSEMIRQPE